LVVERQRPLTELRASHEVWRAEIDQLTRGGKRQAAPCSKGTRVADPKPPRRTPGSGTCRYREAPPPESVSKKLRLLAIVGYDGGYEYTTTLPD
jgi:hypothetical protein